MNNLELWSQITGSCPLIQFRWSRDNHILSWYLVKLLHPFRWRLVIVYVTWLGFGFHVRFAVSGRPRVWSKTMPYLHVVESTGLQLGPLGDFVRFGKLPPKVVTYNLLSQGFKVLYSSETRTGQNGFTGIFSRSCFHREEKRSSSGLYMTKAIYTENAED